MPAYSAAVNGTSSQTYSLNPATGVGMPALGMSGLWASGLGFPRPPCQRINSHSDHGERKTVPPLFSAATATAQAHSFVLLSHPGGIVICVAAILPFSLFPYSCFLSSLLPFLRPTLLPSLSLSPSRPSLFFSCVLMSLSTVFFFFFPRKEEGLC